MKRMLNNRPCRAHACTSIDRAPPTNTERDYINWRRFVPELIINYVRLLHYIYT